MASDLQALITELEDQSKEGLPLTEQMILKALRLPEVQAKVAGLLGEGYALIAATPLPSNTAQLAHLQLSFIPPPGSAWIGVPTLIATFESASGTFVSLTKVLTAKPDEVAFGAVPFALATRSFSHAAGVPASDPHLQAVQQRRADFLATKIPDRSATATATAVNTPYGTSIASTNSGNDYDTVTDYARDWEADYSEDKASAPASDPRLQAGQQRRADFLATRIPDRSATVTATAVDTPYGTSATSTNSGNDYDTETDHSRDWENDYSAD
jgi:hypothetical protein